MAANEKNIVELLTERFFGPQFFEQRALAEKILDCRSISDFEKLKINIRSGVVAGIFADASFVDLEAKKLTAAKLDDIFTRLKPIRANTGYL